MLLKDTLLYDWFNSTVQRGYCSNTQLDSVYVQTDFIKHQIPHCFNGEDKTQTAWWADCASWENVFMIGLDVEQSVAIAQTVTFRFMIWFQGFGESDCWKWT